MIHLFHPHIPKNLHSKLGEVLKTRWLGQGDLVDEFEKKIGKKFDLKYPLFVNSGSSALELACDLLDLKEGDEVISPVLTCTATNIPLIRRGVKIIWADIDPHTLVTTDAIVRKLITQRTKAIMGVNLGGIKCDIKSRIPVIIDGAQAIGHNNGDMMIYSFQAIKHFTTADGGLLNVNDKEMYERAKKLRWFGIDRELKKKKGWQAYQNREMTFDIEEIGYKFQPTDIDATFGLAGLEDYDDIIKHRKKIFDFYKYELDGYMGMEVVDGKDNVYWLCGLILPPVIDRDAFAKRLADYGVETNMVHLRNDIFTVFGGERLDLPNMNYIEDKYIYIPLHTKMTMKDAEYIVEVIKNV